MQVSEILPSLDGLAPYLHEFQKGLLAHTASSLPLLTRLTQYYVTQPSKRLRPCLIFLMCQATNGLGVDWAVKVREAQGFATNDCTNSPEILPSQIRLAQVIEMMHVASLMHDDVIDNAETRRGAPSAPTVFGNHSAVLGGDFVVSRAMALTATLGSPEVMILVSKAFCTLVEGELLQSGGIQNHSGPADAFRFDADFLYCTFRVPPDDIALATMWEDYICKTYMKTACLFSCALQCSVILGGAGNEECWRKMALLYGHRLGMAFQLVDDLLDFTGDPGKLGKPANADLSLGIATAPVLFALEEDESIREFVLRRFGEPGDVQKTIERVKNTGALRRTRELAELYADKARQTLSILPESAAKCALSDLAAAILVRQN
ncbi:hypothetical protein ONZ51_g5634 [Trametes cubensis]|uniref:(2E,6E)-farnesyl diphosphate synthase n=1 Tax=Trametes cubensis TaxID=1111947 RepID=A0AAD7XDG0_9APHY|nr:hypothetical protein ONZ51_g5634 [Trametes cubensis]